MLRQLFKKLQYYGSMGFKHLNDSYQSFAMNLEGFGGHVFNLRFI